MYAPPHPEDTYPGGAKPLVLCPQNIVVNVVQRTVVPSCAHKNNRTLYEFCGLTVLLAAPSPSPQLAGHPNIVNMLGLCGTTVVTEYFEDNFLQKIHRHGKTLTIHGVVSLALDVARGMQASAGGRLTVARMIWRILGDV